MEAQVNSERGHSTFAIGAVSRLTGIPMDTLRMWERRYQVVTPQRSPLNRRFYSRDDVTRLLLIKQLVEQGHPVGSIVHLPESDLRDRLQAHYDLCDTGSGAVCTASGSAKHHSVLVYGDALPFQFAQWKAEMPMITVLAGYSSYAEFERDALASQPDILFMEFPALQSGASVKVCDLIHRGGFNHVVVIYAFASRSVLEQLRKVGVVTLRAPVTPAMLNDQCHVMAAIVHRLPIKTTYALPSSLAGGRRFAGAKLARLAQESGHVICECPQHLADILARVGAFEQYSAECENRNEKDALVHARLNHAAGWARAILEDALEHLLQSEDIPADTLTESMTDKPPVASPSFQLLDEA
jgi:DNA-binding transcriptional MerR regulator